MTLGGLLLSQDSIALPALGVCLSLGLSSLTAVGGKRHSKISRKPTASFKSSPVGSLHPP